MKAIGKNIVVKETLTKRENTIELLTDDASKDLTYERKAEVIHLGDEVPIDHKGYPVIQLGNQPVFAEWSEPAYTIIKEGKRGDKTIIRESIYPLSHIVGILD